MEKTVLPRLAKAMNGWEFSLPRIFFVSSHYVLCIKNYDFRNIMYIKHNLFNLQEQKSV